MRKKIRFAVAAAIIHSVSPGAALAMAEDASALIDTVVEAYGGERLLNLRSYVYDIDLRDFLFHGGRAPDISDISEHRMIVAYDGEHDRYSVEDWVFPEGGEPYHQLQIFSVDDYVRYDFRPQDFRAEDAADIAGLTDVFISRQPALLVRQMANRKEAIEKLEDERFYDKPHHVIRYAPVGAPPLKIFIDGETYRLTKAEWTSSAHQVGLVTYFYGQHRENNGILVAERYVNKAYGRIYQDTIDKKVSFNSDVSAYFRKPQNFATAVLDDLSEMQATTIAPDLVHVGRDLDYTLFIDLGDQLAAYGARRGLKSRYEEYQRATDDRRPLSVVIVDHHHADHLWGINDFADEKLSFIAAPAHREAVRSAYEGYVSDEQFLTFEQSMALGEKFQLYDIETRHSEHNLILHGREAGIIAAADHIFVDGRQRGFGAPYQNMKDFISAVDRLQLDADRFVTIHNRRIFDADAVKAHSEAPLPADCFENRPICADARLP